MGLLITAEQTVKLKNGIIFDCSFNLRHPNAGRQQYASRHIPGSHYLDLAKDMSGDPGKEGRHPLPVRENFAERLRDLGVNGDSSVICYDQNESAYATRLWWMVRWLGHEDVYVLDGGLKAWIEAGLDTDTRPASATQGNFIIQEPLTKVRNADDLVNTDDKIIDAREESRFLGLEEPIDPVAGHIPGATCAPFIENLDEGYFLKPVELQKRFSRIFKDDPPDRKMVCYCGSGVTATHNILALMLAGFEEPALYPGSWSHWINDPRRPIERSQ